MIQWIKQNKVFIVSLMALSASIPIGMVAYRVIFEGENAVHITFDSPLEWMIVIYYLILILLGIILSLKWLFEQIQIIKHLKNEKTKAELLHLKSQLNPHFFFNMLNNLYGWIDKDQDRAKEIVLKLSEMMRYSVYQSKEDEVALEKELEFIQQYIDLHQMRYRKNVAIEYITEIDHPQTKIPPLLLIILIENAFKHGVESLRDQAFINILIKSNADEIYVKVVNNYNQTISTKSGIGLENLKKRLNIMFDRKHKLSTQSKDDIFTAELRISNK